MVKASRNKPIPFFDFLTVGRFIASYVKRESGCWDWTATRDRENYGVFVFSSTKYKAHRLSYFIHFKEQPEDKVVAHSCDRPCCVNPEHLFLTTPIGNVEDCMAKLRHGLHESNGRAIMTEQQVLYIKSEYAKGLKSQKELGLEVGLGRSQIGNIVRGDQWNHNQR